MPYLFVGLGNPGDKYENTRHNAGRMVLEAAAESCGFSPWRRENKAKAFLVDGEIAQDDVTLLLPDNFMNRSGESVRKLVTDPKDAAHMVVVHDEIDLPLGEFKIVFGKGAGGHNGVQSIIDHVHTKDFTRVRIGVSPLNWFGRMKKPQGKKAVTDFLLSDFKKRERDKMASLFPEVQSALEAIVRDGVMSAMNEFNNREEE